MNIKLLAIVQCKLYSIIIFFFIVTGWCRFATGENRSGRMISVLLKESCRRVSVICEDWLQVTSDSGESLKFCLKYLKMAGVKKITTATLFYKPGSVVKPDFYICTTKAWIIFPPEVREAVSDIGGRWIKDGMNETEAISRLVKIGLPKDQVEYFIKKCQKN